jgi:hypothetical protein
VAVVPVAELRLIGKPQGGAAAPDLDDRVWGYGRILEEF